MGQGILLSADSEIDFMIHGIFKYKFFFKISLFKHTDVEQIVVSVGPYALIISILEFNE